jgi:predicted PurR-regulated permease PerM
MTFVVQQKRKNDQPRPFPAWIIVLFALGLVIVAVLLFRPTVRGTIQSSNPVVNTTSNSAAQPANSAAQPAVNAQAAPQSNAAPADNSVVATPQAGQLGS